MRRRLPGVILGAAVTATDLQTERSALEAEIATLRGRLEAAKWTLMAAEARGRWPRGFWPGFAVGAALVAFGAFGLFLMFLRVVSHID